MRDAARPRSTRTVGDAPARRRRTLVPEETAVAFTYDGGTYAVMMATPPISRILRSASA